MSRIRYSAARKIEAVKRVVEDGCSVCDVAREAGVSEGSLFFWVRRHRQFMHDARMRGAMVANAGPQPERAHEFGSLVAYLRRANSA